MSDFNYPTTIDRMIVSARKLQGLDQFQLATRAGITRTFISYFESGRVLPTEQQLTAIEAALGIRFSDPAVQAAFSVLLGAAPARDGQAQELPNAQ